MSGLVCDLVAAVVFGAASLESPGVPQPAAGAVARIAPSEPITLMRINISSVCSGRGPARDGQPAFDARRGELVDGLRARHRGGDAYRQRRGQAGPAQAVLRRGAGQVAPDVG